MADEDDDDLEFEQADAGVAFRAEMAATNFMLGYWQYLVAIIVVVLLGFLFYGQYQSWHLNDQREASRRIFEVEKGLRTDEAPTPEVYGVVADQMIEVEARGMAHIEALLKAAELYRLAEDAENQRLALERAAAEGSGVLGYAAEAALANLDLEAGDGDAATARLQSLADANEGFLAEQASLDLALMYEHLERLDDARDIYARFPERFPESQFAEEAALRLAKLGEG